MCKFKQSAKKIELTVTHLSCVHPQYKSVDEHKLFEVASSTAFYVQSDLLHLVWEGLPDLNPVTEVDGEDLWTILVLYHETKLTFNLIFIYKRLYIWVSIWCPSQEFCQLGKMNWY